MHGYVTRLLVAHGRVTLHWAFGVLSLMSTLGVPVDAGYARACVCLVSAGMHSCTSGQVGQQLPGTGAPFPLCLVPNAFTVCEHSLRSSIPSHLRTLVCNVHAANVPEGHSVVVSLTGCGLQCFPLRHCADPACSPRVHQHGKHSHDQPIADRVLRALATSLGACMYHSTWLPASAYGSEYCDTSLDLPLTAGCHPAAALHTATCSMLSRACVA